MVNNFDKDQTTSDPIATRAQELEELAEKQAGTSALQKIVQKHLSLVEEIRDKFPLDGIELLSDHLANHRSIVGSVNNEVGKLREKIRVVVEEVAAAVENRKYKASEEAIAKMSLGFKERARVNSLLSADKDRLISCQSINTAIEIFSELNKLIKQQIEDSTKTGDRQRERNLLLFNAILVYELTDFLIKYIGSFEARGIEIIYNTYNESMEKNAELKAKLELIRQQAQSENINSASRMSTLADVAMREKAIELVSAEWDRYMDQIDKTQQEISLLQNTNIPTLELIRLNAESQIDAIEVISVLQIVNRSLGALQQAQETLEGMELVSLSEERVYRLLGIDDRTS